MLAAKDLAGYRIFIYTTQIIPDDSTIKYNSIKYYLNEANDILKTLQNQDVQEVKRLLLYATDEPSSGIVHITAHEK